MIFLIEDNYLKIDEDPNWASPGYWKNEWEWKIFLLRKKEEKILGLKTF